MYPRRILLIGAKLYVAILLIIMSSIRKLPNRAVSFYTHAYATIKASEFAPELAWQYHTRLEDLTETRFLRELAWVIINSGFREHTARQKFPAISLAFGDWESAEFITSNRDLCITCALHAFAHPQKINAIADGASLLSQIGLPQIQSQMQEEPIETLKTFPFIGEVTAWHLAKNLGCDVAKPDRHLVRIAQSFGFDCVHEFCALISQKTGDRVALIDLALWRYTASFSQRERSIKKGA